jgi:Tol biopolymer transport system component
MRARTWIKLVTALLAGLILGSCSSHTPNPSATGTSSPSATVSPSPSTSKKARHVPSARRAVYSDNGAIWLYDVKTNATRQLTQGGTARLPKWVSANQISFVQGSNDGTESTLRLIDLKTNDARDLFTVPGGINTYGWSPDHQTVAYVTTDSDGYPHVRFRSIPDEATQAVATLARALGRGADANDESRIEFSKDGRYVLIVYTPADGTGQKIPKEQSQLQVRALDGSLAFAADMSREPTMGMWSLDGKTMFYRDKGGIRSWTPSAGTQSHAVRSGLSWFNPSPSRDGKQVAFDTGSDSPSVRIRVLTFSNATYDTVSASGRAFPVFAGRLTVWAQTVRACKGCEGPTAPESKVFAIDTRSGKERALAIRSLLDVDVQYA